MRILIEEYQYDVSKVKDILHGIDALENVEGKVSIHYVGYYYNTLLKDCVFILPKVLLQDVDGQELAFGKYKPEDIVMPDQNKEMEVQEKDFLYKFAVWIYRAIVVYKNDKGKDTDIVYHTKIAQIGKGMRRLSNTYLDILLQLLQFNRDNQSFFFFIVKNLHSGYNKINWTRTISRETAIVQSGQPVYLKPVNKKRQINFDEELLVIFFSILNYISDTYGFAKDIKCQFDLIKGPRFQTYLNGFGLTRLRQIKYKYFSDKALELWNLCYAFFDEARQVLISTDKKEYLLVKSFYIVFEAIIDELIGDSKDDLPKDFKEQKDGKLVDHLYTYPGLIEADDEQRTYYIGDSKYYKLGAPLGDNSIYKQYTYARNIVQYSIDLWLDDSVPNPEVRLRDEMTEGYNVIPNFFISAAMKPGDYSYNHREIELTHTGRKNPEIKYQFKDRLFDRDTMLLSRYNVNFLFVLSLYARNHQLEKAAWKEEVRKQFREQIRKVLAEHYEFYALKSKGNPLAGEEFIKEHFKELQGKLYRPYGDKNIFSLALERHDGTLTKDSEAYQLLEEFFEIEPIKKLGDYPKDKLEQRVAEYQTEHPYSPTPEDWLPKYHVERYMEDYFVLGVYHNQEHWDWITGKNDRGTLIYNVRLDPDRDGSMPKSRIRKMKPKFAILYEEGHVEENKYHVFRIHDFAVMSEERMRQARYPREPKGDYFIFRFDEEVSIGRFDINQYISLKRQELGFVFGMPLYLRGKELLEYKENPYLCPSKTPITQ